MGLCDGKLVMMIEMLKSVFSGTFGSHTNYF